MDNERTTNALIPRFLGRRLAPSAETLTLLLGMAGCGKRTLVRAYLPNLRYFDVSRADDRELLLRLPSAEWRTRIGPAAVDNLHTAPRLQQRILRLFEEATLPPTVLIMSAQPDPADPLWRLSPARSQRLELWPLTAAELASAAAPAAPLLSRLLTDDRPLDALLAAEPTALGEAQNAPAEAAIRHLLDWGGLPALTQLDEAKRSPWLADYEERFPERNAGATGRLKPLPFRRFRRACAAHAVAPLSQTQLVRAAHVNIRTGRRYLEHLQRLYQLFLLESFVGSLPGTPVKAPQLHMLDIGLWRQLLDGDPSREQLLQALLAIEVYKWTHFNNAVTLHTFRTHAGLSVDLLLESAAGVMALQMLPGAALAPPDARPLLDIARGLGARWRGGLLVYEGRALQQLAPGIWAVPLARLLALPPFAIR